MGTNESGFPSVEILVEDRGEEVPRFVFNLDGICFDSVKAEFFTNAPYPLTRIEVVNEGGEVRARGIIRVCDFPNGTVYGPLFVIPNMNLRTYTLAADNLAGCALIRIVDLPMDFSYRFVECLESIVPCNRFKRIAAALRANHRRRLEAYRKRDEDWGHAFLLHEENMTKLRRKASRIPGWPPIVVL